MSVADSFSRHDNVDRFLKIPHPTRLSAEHYSELVGWPVKAWKVLVPRPTTTGSDPLQRAIFRLSQAGCRTAEQIAEWLDINLTLSRTLVQLYQQNGFIKPDGALTDAGRRLMIEDDQLTFSDRSHQQGWIFQDSVSGDMIPYFRSRPINRARPEEIKNPFIIPTSGAVPAAPGVGQIRDTLKRYRRYVNASSAARREGVEITSQDELDNFGEGDLEVPGVARVIAENPISLNLPVHFVVPPDDPLEWSLITGFRAAAMDGWFTRKMRQALPKNQSLKSIVDTWLKNARELYPVRPSLTEAESIITAEIPVLASPELMATRKEMAKAYRGEALFNENSENFDIVLVRYQRALEAVLDACIEATSNRVAIAARVNTRGFDSQIRTVALRLKVNLPPIRDFTNFASKIKRLDRRQGQSLRDRSLFLLLSANDYHDSPAREAFARDPDLLIHLDLVTEYRNKRGAHFASIEWPVSKMELTQIAESSRKVVRVFAESFFAGHSPD